MENVEKNEENRKGKEIRKKGRRKMRNVKGKRSDFAPLKNFPVRPLPLIYLEFVHMHDQRNKKKVVF